MELVRMDLIQYFGNHKYFIPTYLYIYKKNHHNYIKGINIKYE